MTTKKTTKATKPATKATKAPYVATSAHVDLARSAGLNIRNGESAKEAVNKACAELHKAGAVVGDARTCPLAQAFLDKRYPLGKGLNGKKVSAQVKANALSAFRAAVKSGKGYSENKGREKAKAKGKTGAKAGGAIMLAFPAGVTMDAIAKTLSNGILKMKESGNENLVRLASYLVDVVAEIGEDETE